MKLITRGGYKMKAWEFLYWNGGIVFMFLFVVSSSLMDSLFHKFLFISFFAVLLYLYVVNLTKGLAKHRQEVLEEVK